MPQRVIMHIDVNSAYLSWQAVYNLQAGDRLDLRTVPSAVGGSQASRRGIILAKSIPAKKCGVQTGEVIWQARQKCEDLIIVPPNYDLYMKCSAALYSILQEYSPLLQRFSIDEIFLDYSGMEAQFGEPVEAAHRIKDRIHQELGFTVNVGVSSNKLLAKVAGDFKKPDLVHTLWPDEIEKKMWPLPVQDLFMVGSRTARKLQDLQIYTIGDLAKADMKLLTSRLKSFGSLVHSYANGQEFSPIKPGYYLPMKGIGNSTTIHYDVESAKEAYQVLLSLVESVAMRLRAAGACCRVIEVGIRSARLEHYSHERKIYAPTNITMDIYSVVCELFNEVWNGEKIRHLGVRVGDLSSDEFIQLAFDQERNDKKAALDAALDCIRNRYGKYSVMRATFADGSFSPMSGGVGDDDFVMMSSML